MTLNPPTVGHPFCHKEPSTADGRRRSAISSKKGT